jgi:hypothetical protein
MTRVLLTAIAALTLAAPASAQKPPLTKIQLRSVTVIDGVACGPTGRASAWTFPSGTLESCPLAHDTIIAAQQFDAGTWLYFDQNRQLVGAWLEQDTRLGGHVCKGTGYKGWSVRFHPNGTLQSCFLAGEETIQGVPCRKGSFWGELTGGVQVSFYDDGSLESCSAARDIRIGSVVFAKRERVWLDRNGAVIKRAPLTAIIATVTTGA